MYHAVGYQFSTQFYPHPSTWNEVERKMLAAGLGDSSTFQQIFCVSTHVYHAVGYQFPTHFYPHPWTLIEREENASCRERKLINDPTDNLGLCSDTICSIAHELWCHAVDTFWGCWLPMYGPLLLSCFCPKPLILSHYCPDLVSIVSRSCPLSPFWLVSVYFVLSFVPI